VLNLASIHFCFLFKSISVPKNKKIGKLMEGFKTEVFYIPI